MKAGSSWMVALLPPLVVVVFTMLHRALPAPTAAGLSFLVAALAAYRLAPRTRINILKLAFGLVAAVVLAVLLTKYLSGV